MQKRLLVVVATASLSLVPLLLSGCGAAVTDTATASGTFHVIGQLHGGQQPVSGSTIQLYAANSTTNAGAATALLTKTVTTDANGFFSITGDYTCPASNPLVYIVATGGNPGLPGGSVNNSSIAMMSLLGTCNALFAAGDSAFVYINEFTTVASVQFIASFMTGYANVGSAPSNPAALAGAFQSYANEVNVTNGQYQGGISQLPVTGLQIDTLANILAACVNTDGTGTPCSKLLADTGSTDTVSAALHMVQSPGNNTADLYSIIGPTPPFQPYFSTVPSDFTTIVGYAIPDNILGGTLDSNGHIWLYTGGYSYDTVNDISTDNPGVITVYDNSFTPMFTIALATTPVSGGLYYPTSFSSDAQGHVFAVNSNGTISEFGAAGNALSPAGGWPTGITTTFTGTGPGNGYISSTPDIGPLVADASGKLFGGAPFSSSNCYFAMSTASDNAGTVDTPAGGNLCVSTLTSTLETFTSDGSGNLWIMGGTAIAKANTSGNVAVTAPPSQGCFYVSSNLSGNFSTDALESITRGLAYDHVNGQLWGSSETGIGAVTDAGAPVFCNYGPTMPALPEYSSTSTTPGDPYSAGGALITGGVLDGAGNFFFITGSTAASGVVGNSSGTFTGSATYSTFLGKISPSGSVLTPYNAATKVYGLQPAGVGINGTATSTNGTLSPVGNVSAFLLGVDVLGNIWAEDLLNKHIIKITGLATANTVNY